MDTCPAFVDETGVLTGSLHEQPVYGIGLLVVPEPRQLTESLYKVHFNLVSERRQQRLGLRRKVMAGSLNPTVGELERLMWASRHHEYKFSEVSAHNLQPYLDLLNVYFSYPGVQFHSMIIDRLQDNFDAQAWKDHAWRGYCGLAKELLWRRLDRDAFVIADLQGKPNAEEYYLEDAVCTIPRVKGCLRAASEMSIFLQLVDLLLGCVQFDWKDQHHYYGSTSGRAEAKRRLTAFVKAKLGVRSDETLLPPNLPYRAWRKPSIFTAWRMVPKAERLLGKEVRKGAAMSGAHPV
ncbi:MAG: DUF3800 domain-containing protein [Dehalococcoidia bacterium]